MVETVNFNDKTWVDRRGVPHSEEMRVVERIRRVNEDRLRIDITVEDPVAFTETWTGQRHYRRVAWDIEEFVCMDNVNFEQYERDVLEYEGRTRVTPGNGRDHEKPCASRQLPRACCCTPVASPHTIHS